MACVCRCVFSFTLVCLVALFLCGCATQTYAPDVAPEYVIIRDASGFYRLGPEQGHGPDALLPVQTRVKLLRREMGFSLVQMEDSKTGYIANENMAVAPPRPPQLSTGDQNFYPRKGGGKSTGRPYFGPQVNDAPLPKFEGPAPDLKIQPDIVPDTIPVPSDAPGAGPKFRY